MTDTVYTIGHSTHSIDNFIGLLKAQSITAVCDVRSRPYSRMNPQFNREPLKQRLRAASIRYVFLGEELGARSKDKTCYRNGQVQFDILARTALFKQGIERVKIGARSYRVALMCAEKEPLECHRTILVARRLADEGITIQHILGDGSVEQHEHTIERLVTRLRIPGADMFRPTDAVIKDAYKRQAGAIAYREESSESGVTESSGHDKRALRAVL
jgi:uncharacterized protein (DUF488 family)